MVNEYRERLLVALSRVRARPLTATIAAAGVVMFLLLLGESAGVAVLVSLLVLPFVVLFYLTRLDLYEREPWALLAGVVGAGALIGLIGGFLSALIFDRFWFSDSRLNLGAIGFSGISANGEGSVPFGVLLLNGIVIPVLTGAAVLGGPIVLRRWPVFRNEITDGMTLGALAAGGFATVSAFVYFWPSAFEDLPDRPVSQWTALLAGIVVIRPVVLILAGSLLGIAAWQYASSRDIRSVLVVGIVGVFGWLALPFGSLLLAPSGAVPEFVWYAAVLVIVGVLFRHALGRSLALDRQVLSTADGERRVVCPNCHRVTPDGSFCSFCRAPLHPDTPAALIAAQTTGQIAADPIKEQEPVPAPTARFGEDEDLISAPADLSSAEQVGAQPERGPRFQPVMATDPVSSTEPAHGDPVTRSPWRDFTRDEPEADGFDELDRPGVTTTPPPERAASAPEPLPIHTPASGSSPTNDTSRFRDARGWNPPANSTASRVTEPITLDPAETEDEGLLPTDESTDRTPPTSIQDWSRRSVESAADDPIDQDGDGGAVSAGPAPDETLMSRSDASDDDVPSGIDWPTSGGDLADDRNPAAGQRPFDFGRARPRSEGSPLEGDGESQPSRGDQPPVLSSSGRWFDASTSQGVEQGRAASAVDDPTQHDELSSVEPDVDQPAETRQPTAAGPGEGGDRSTETESTGAQTTPRGLRWYRQDDEPARPEDEGFEEPGDASEHMSAEVSSSTSPRVGGIEIAAAPDPPNVKSGRSGIWRSFGRQGRIGAPRAPQRDQNGPDSAAADQSDRTDDKP